MDRISKPIALASLALSTALLAASAQAQQTSASNTADAGTSGGAEDIVVTARRINERLQDVPLAVTVIQGDALRARGVTLSSELKQTVAGLISGNAAGRTSSLSFGLRGQRTSDIAVTQDAPVAIYVDEVVAVPLQGSSLSLFDLENVQVLKGPQGTLFGRNTTGGAILYTTAKPTDEFGGYVRVGLSKFGGRTAQGAINIPVNEQIRLRAAADYLKSDGFGRVVAAPGANPGSRVGTHQQSRDDLSLRFTAAVDPSDRVKTMTSVYYSRGDDGPVAYVLADDPNPLAVAGAVFGQAFFDASQRAKQRSKYSSEYNPTGFAGFRTRLFGINNTASVELNDDLTFKNIFGYRRLRYREANDVDGTILPVQSNAGITNIDVYSEEVQLQGTALDSRLNFTVGSNYFKQTGYDGSDGSVTLGSMSSVGGQIANESVSAFAQGTYKLSDTLNFTGGIRYTTDRRAYDLVSRAGNLANPGNCALRDANNVLLPNTACVIRGRASFSAPSWLFSLDKKLSTDTLVYVSTRRGYRSGGFNLRGAGVNTIGPFQPETVYDVELGLKSTTPIGGAWELRTNVAAYYQWYKKIQRSSVAVINGAVGNVIINAASAHIMGLEAEIDFRRGKFFDLNFNYAYVKPKYDSFPVLATVNGVGGQPDDYSDRDFSQIPRHQFNANIVLSPDVGDIGDLTLTGNLYYQSRIYFSDSIQTRAQLRRTLSPAAQAVMAPNIVLGQKGYALVNGRVELAKIAGTGLSVALWGKNLFDKRYSEGGTGIYGPLGYNVFVFSPPRTLGVEIGYKF